MYSMYRSVAVSKLLMKLERRLPYISDVTYKTSAWLLILFFLSISLGNVYTPMSGKALVAVDYEVFGMVQGVFFRKYTQKKASELGLKGWVKNTSQGTVIGQLEGERERIQEMKHWLAKIGSPQSMISKCDFKEEKEIQAYTYKDFKVKH